MEKIKKLNEYIVNPTYADYSEKIELPSFSVDIYLPEFYGASVLDYGGPNKEEIKRDVIQLIKDKINRVKGINVDLKDQKVSPEYKNIYQFDKDEDKFNL